jgi:hypothetical protein
VAIPEKMKISGFSKLQSASKSLLIEKRRQSKIVSEVAFDPPLESLNDDFRFFFSSVSVRAFPRMTRPS